MCLFLTEAASRRVSGGSALASSIRCSCNSIGVVSLTRSAIPSIATSTCPHCDEPVDIFGRGASKRVCQQYSIEFLGEIPIDPMVRIGGDDGIPASVGAPESPTAKQFAEVARGLAGKISIHNLNRAEALPTIQMYSAPR